MEEKVILVNEKDEEIGKEEKIKAHKLGLLHRCFSILVFNSSGELLLQKRASGKYHSGGLWSNTCCGHPRPGEDVISAASRRLHEEMGFSCELRKIMVFSYKAKLDHGLTENEFDHVLTGKYDGDPVLNSEEAGGWRFVSLEALEKEINGSPEKFTVWFKIIILKLKQAGIKN